MSIEALIFDCDGTLADTMPPHYEAWVAALAPHGLELTEERFYALGGWPVSRVIELLAREASRHDLDVDVIEAAKQSEFDRRLHLVGPIAPIVQIAADHRGKLPMAVASGSRREAVRQILTHLEIIDWFEVYVGAEDSTCHKPEPGIFLEAARRLGVAAENCRVYEDTDVGIEAAERAGMTWVDVREYYQPRRITA